MSEMKMNAEESVIERLTRERDEFSLASSKNLERAHDAEDKVSKLQIEMMEAQGYIEGQDKRLAEMKTELRRWIDKDIEADRIREERDELVRKLSDLIKSVEFYAENGLIENYHNDMIGGTLSDHVEIAREALKQAREGSE